MCIDIFYVELLFAVKNQVFFDNSTQYHLNFDVQQS